MSYKYDFSGGGAGGYDYASMLKTVLGGGSKPQSSGGISGGYTFAPSRFGIAGNPLGPQGITGSLTPVNTYDRQKWINDETMRMNGMDPNGGGGGAGSADAAAMERAQLAARTQMAQSMIQAQIAAEQRKNDIELQRRNALQSQYEQKNKAYYDYGIS